MGAPQTGNASKVVRLPVRSVPVIPASRNLGTHEDYSDTSAPRTLGTHADPVVALGTHENPLISAPRALGVV